MKNGKTIYELVIQEALKISKRDLRDLYVGPSIIAGRSHFDDYWARDSFFASWGALAMGDYEKVKENLNFFISFQKKNGLIPRRIDRFYFTRFLKYFLRIRIPRFRIKPIYNGRFFQPNIDPNSIFVITAEKYITATNDKKWLSENISCINNALIWLKYQDKDGDFLVEEGALSNWMDTVKKFHKMGKTFYSNVLTWKALEVGERLNKIIGYEFPEEVAAWKKLLKFKIMDSFWNGRYFSDWIYRGDRFDYFSTDSNMLAIILGFPEKKQSLQILATMADFFGREPLPPPVNYPSYPRQYLALRHALSGLPGYHNAYGRWLWVAALSALAHRTFSKETRVLQEFGVISDWIVAHRKVFEVYNPDGTPYHRRFWKSESPFAWNAGIFIWVAKELGLF